MLAVRLVLGAVAITCLVLGAIEKSTWWGGTLLAVIALAYVNYQRDERG
jgi:hypothetical protein